MNIETGIEFSGKRFRPWKIVYRFPNESHWKDFDYYFFTYWGAEWQRLRILRK